VAAVKRSSKRTTIDAVDRGLLEELIRRLDSSKITEAEARRRRAVAAAAIAELNLAQQQGQLIPFAQIRAFEAGNITAARAALLPIGAELADDLAGISDPVAIRERIDRRVHAALAKLTEWKPEGARRKRKTTQRRRPDR